MRRSKIKASLYSIIKAINETGIQDAIEKLSVDRKRNLAEEVISIFEKITMSKNNWNTETTEVVEIMGIQSLFDKKSWIALISGNSSDKQATINSLNIQLENFFAVKNVVLELLKSSTDPDDLETLSLVFVDENNDMPIDNLAHLISGLQMLREVYKTYFNVDIEEVKLIRCDSGSNKEFIFGIPRQAYSFFRDFLASIWQRLAFYEEEKAERKLELVSKSIPLLAELNSKKEEIGDENSKILEKMVIDTALELTKSNSTLAELENVESEKTKLLGNDKPLQIEHKK